MSPVEIRYAAFLILVGAILAAGCSTRGSRITEPADGAPAVAVDFDAIPEPEPREEPLSRYGNPPMYEVNGVSYRTLTSREGYVERGIASWYGTKFHGQRTSSGEPYDMYRVTAAHRSLPLPSFVRVTNLENGRKLVVRVNDRGPFHPNRIIDLSYAAAGKLGILGEGTGLVEVRAIDPRRPEPETRSAAAQRPGAPSLFVQVGAFASRYNAESLRERLQESLQRTVRIQEHAQPQRPVYRVQVGPVETVESADRLTLRLADLGIRDVHVVVE
ncbi:MAG: septal ring lytic transglycosylase RlpA family protein [Chromatiales bacterium]